MTGQHGQARKERRNSMSRYTVRLKRNPTRYLVMRYKAVHRTIYHHATAVVYVYWLNKLYRQRKTVTA